ncbi:MAG: M48 family metallopeptidase, partial [Acidobacteriota bacterium]
SVPSSQQIKFCTECGTALSGHPQNQHFPDLCSGCGGNGVRLPLKESIHVKCRWLRPLAPQYHVDCAAFQYAQDGSAMAALRSSGPLAAAARAISDRVGRRWIEITFNGIRLGPNQLPRIHQQAVQAARILGMPYMPDIYISGERMWDAVTYGTDEKSFVILGTGLAANFQGEDLLFILAREMGHCRAGHALWKTVIHFLLGEQGPRKGRMASGVLSALNPFNLVEGALEMPLLAWARQAEITADRAGLLAIGKESVARRVLLSWSLKSSMLYRQINIQAWMNQENESSDDEMMKLSEMAISSTPYIARRLKLMKAFADSGELRHYRDVIERHFPRAMTPAQAKPETVRILCPHCKKGMQIPATQLEGKTAFHARCPNTNCRKVITLKRKKDKITDDE